MKIIIYGDLCPTKQNIGFFSQNNYQQIFNEVIQLNSKYDYRIFNLECVFNDKRNSYKKLGPYHVHPTNYIKTLSAAGFNIASVANNHSLDNGLNGLVEEIKELNRNGIGSVGQNLKDDKKPYITFKKDDICVCLYSVSDKEFNYDKSGLGVNIYDSKKTSIDLELLSEKCASTIVLYHSGIENYNKPTPLLMKRCREMIENGASVVICQHSHCIGLYEEYKNGLILYGQGNFLFDITNRKTWKESLAVELIFSKEGFSYKFIPLEVKNGCVNIINKANAEEILNDLKDSSSKIQDTEYVNKSWEFFLLENSWKYNAMLLGNKKIHYIFCKLISLFSKKIILSKYKLEVLKLLMTSDTHNEAILKLISIQERES